MDLPKGSAWKTEEELNRYLIEKYPGENTNLHRLSIYMNALGIDQAALMKSMEIPGSPFIKIASRD